MAPFFAGPDNIDRHRGDAAFCDQAQAPMRAATPAGTAAPRACCTISRADDIRLSLRWVWRVERYVGGCFRGDEAELRGRLCCEPNVLRIERDRESGEYVLSAELG